MATHPGHKIVASPFSEVRVDPDKFPTKVSSTPKNCYSMCDGPMYVINCFLQFRAFRIRMLADQPKDTFSFIG